MEQEPWFWTEKQADQHGLHPMEHTIIFVPCGPCVQVHEGTVIIELSNNQHLVKIHYIGCAWLACQCTLTQTGDNMLVYVKVVILVTTNWLDEYYSPMCYSQDRLTCDISWRALFGASNACRFAAHMWASLLERRYQQALHQLAWRKNVPSSCVFEIEKQHTHLECFGWDAFYLSTLGICLKKIIHLIFLQFSTEFVLHIAIRIMLYPAGWFAELEEPLVQPSWSYSWIYWLISLTENKQNSSKFQVAYPHGYKWCDLYTIWETQQWPWANPDISHGNASHPSISWLVKLWKAQGVSPGMGCQEKVSATDACCVSKQFWIQRAKIPRLPRAGNVLHSMQQVTASIIYNHIYIYYIYVTRWECGPHHQMCWFHGKVTQLNNPSVNDGELLLRGSLCWPRLEVEYLVSSWVLKGISRKIIRIMALPRCKVLRPSHYRWKLSGLNKTHLHTLYHYIILYD